LNKKIKEEILFFKIKLSDPSSIIFKAATQLNKKTNNKVKRECKSKIIFFDTKV
jgi:hypothetical protein